jgi:histidinol phosphatase-like PHP family hydrolase
MHSTWSDGGESIATMASACMELGQTCMGVTDHSARAADRARHQHDECRGPAPEIDRVNEQLEGASACSAGIEANILADGNLDLQPPSDRCSNSSLRRRIRSSVCLPIRRLACLRR